jgi:hypothetical protein
MHAYTSHTKLVIVLRCESDTLLNLINKFTGVIMLSQDGTGGDVKFR